METEIEILNEFKANKYASNETMLNTEQSIIDLSKKELEELKIKY